MMPATRSSTVTTTAGMSRAGLVALLPCLLSLLLLLLLPQSRLAAAALSLGAEPAAAAVPRRAVLTAGPSPSSGPPWSPHPQSQQPPPAPSPQPAPAPQAARVTISEVHPAPSNYYEPSGSSVSCAEPSQLLDSSGDAEPEADGKETSSRQAWIRLLNQEHQDVSLQGWLLTLAAPDGQELWRSELAVTLPTGGAALLADVGCAASSSPGEMHRALQQLYAVNGSSPGGTLLLKRADGSVASSVGPGIPRLPPRTTWGLSLLAKAAAASGSSAPLYTALADQGRGSNDNIAQQGPAILGLDCQLAVQPLPGSDLVIHAAVAPNLGDVKNVYLSYQVDYGNNASVPFTKVSSQGSTVTYQARIPSSSFSTGSMVRWQALATDSSGRQSMAPWAEPSGVPRCGTVIGPPVSSPGVPVLEWFTPSPEQAMTEKGAVQGSLFYGGVFYDNVRTHRRGVTSLSHPKPKLSFKLTHKMFQYMAGRPPVNKFGLQSFWFELGERSYMKEPLALQTFDLAGVTSPTSFHVQVRRNGKFFGLFGYVEDIDGTFLKRHNLDPHGPLIKAVSGELSNLRWDLPVDQMPYYYTKGNRKNYSEDWNLLKDFNVGLAGGGPEPRSKFIFDSLELPEIINEMAAQALVLNMDRCTKNFYIYRNPETQRWFRFPWDLDASFGQDNGLGGAPGDKYCVLACEQWNNPLYCDSEHTQDLQKMTAWGVVAVKMDEGSYQGPSRSLGHRRQRLLQQAPPSPSGSSATAASPYPKPQGWDNPDRDTSGNVSVTGVTGTYNHLVDAVLDVEATRQMYLRRLRSLTDQLLVSGKIAQLANETYARIASLARQDAALWHSGIDVQRGYLQIVTEFLPRRTEQLTKQYGPGGSYPLLPSSQAPDARVYIRRIVRDPSNISFSFVELNNPSSDAVDITAWQLQGSWQFSFAPGTVLPVHRSLYVAARPREFMARSSSPHGGEGLFVVGPLRGSPSSSDQEVRLLNAAGQVLQSCHWDSSADSCS